jgi:DUF917 family protein
MPDNAIRSEVDVDDFIRGLMILGTGGGGHPEVGREYLLSHIREGRSLGWADLDDIADDAWVCSVFGMGSIAPQPRLSDGERRRLGYGDVQVPHPMAEAVEQLAAYTGRDIRAIVAFELGAGNTPGPLDTAKRLGMMLADADYAGRAIPELAQTTIAVAGYPLWPAAICDPWGLRLFMKSAPSAAVAERVGKMVSQVTKRPDPLVTCAHAGFLVRAADMKKLVVPGTLTLALQVGTAVRQSREANADPIQGAVAALNGWLLFTGTIIDVDWESRDGYMFGTTLIEGSDEFEGHTFKIWYQNENHITWYDGEPYVTSPDLVMLVDKADAEPFTNTHLSEGRQVAVLGARAPEKYRAESGLEALGPTHFGFDLPYVPIESLVNQERG